MTEELDGRSALARRLLPGGVEPDPRFTLANERTLLAWMRTSLALIGGGIAVEAFATEAFSPAVRTAASALLLILGIFVSLGAVTRWLSTERHLRYGRPLRMPLIAGVLGAGIALVGILFLIFAFS